MDKLGRTRHVTQSNGPKPIPKRTSGAISGELEDADVPDGLCADGAAFWLTTLASMRKAGIHEKIDWPLLEIAAVTFSIWRQARRDIKLHTSMVLNPVSGELKRNPALVTLKESGASLKSLLSELGLTPTSRAKWAGAVDDDPLAALMKEIGEGKIGGKAC